ncbi:hypothetical protein [Achromobacter denitrificans]|uniref:Uncharacterized protein n=1 Tax=Achromobacter denitrificans TaxID=32002 RepID=A0ABZ3G6H4_ACHDE
MNLEQQGYRFCGHATTREARWIHPADLAASTGWIDMTDATDAEMVAFFCPA